MATNFSKSEASGSPYNRKTAFYMEEDALDSSIELGLAKEYLVCAFIGGVRCGSLCVQSGTGKLGLGKSSLLFNLVTFGDCVKGVEKMIKYLPFARGEKYEAGQSVIGGKKSENLKKNFFFKPNNEHNDELKVLKKIDFDDGKVFRTVGLIYSDMSVGIGRSTNFYELNGSGKQGVFEISKSSLMNFEDMSEFLKFIKTLFNMCLISYAKILEFSPIVCYLLNKMLKLDKSDRPFYLDRDGDPFASLLENAIRFSGNEDHPLLKDRKKFNSFIKITPSILEELDIVDNFFKTYYVGMFSLGTFYVGDVLDGENILLSEDEDNKHKRKITTHELKTKKKKSKNNSENKLNSSSSDNNDDDLVINCPL